MNNKLKPFVKNNKTKYKIIKDIPKTRKSTTNSYIQYNQEKNKWYSLQKRSKLDIICMNLMFSKEKYEFYYNNPDKINKYKIENDYYYEMNYPFPNANPMFYNKNKKKTWMNKIKKMYYYKNDNYWYNIIL